MIRYSDACETQIAFEGTHPQHHVEPWAGLVVEAMTDVVFTETDALLVATAIKHPYCSSAIQKRILEMEMP